MSTTARAKQAAQRKLETLFGELLDHDGFGDLRVEMRLLKRGQKEVIIYCGKQYRYVVDFQARDAARVNRAAQSAAEPGKPD
ncbi:hypothetical protein ACH518_07970 [Methylomonas sp. HW2-6]|uniref:hypothetical protein n=1 Tax=Methylomonas sp. HW2-6 TaxID=3376687 RepID=UPI0040411F1E